MTEQCPTCGGHGAVIRDGYAPDVDIAFLQEEIHPSFFRRLVRILRELKREKDSREGTGNARLAAALNIAGGEVMGGAEWTVTHKDNVKKGA